MADTVYMALGILASIPTWHTGHGADEYRFNEAIAALDDSGVDITAKEVSEALSRYRDEVPEMLGGKASDRELERHVQCVLAALNTRRAVYRTLRIHQQVQ